MLAKDTINLKQFPIVVLSKCNNLQKIYPLKQKQVAAIYEIVKKYDSVRRVIVFGSSVTGRCHIDSDLDICIDADTSDGMEIYNLQSEIGTACDWNCDIIMYKNLGNRLKKTVDDEGVVIYE